MAFPILGAGSLAEGYNIENSLRFDQASSHFLSTTFGSAGNRKTFTISLWCKLGHGTGSELSIAGAGGTSGGNPRSYFQFEPGSLRIADNVTGSSWDRIITTDKFRDYSAWYHIVAAVDTTQGTAANRMKLYVNGTQVTALGTADYPDQNLDLNWNNATNFYVGAYPNNANYDFAGYMADFYFIDGTAYAPSDFGETNDDGIWIPKESKDDLTFGSNGFFLEFKQSGTGTNSSGLGADTSGNDTHFASNNLNAYDQCTDTPTNNFATFNPSMTFTDIVNNDDDLAWQEGNTKVTGGTGGTSWTPSVSSIGVSSGKWYYEFYNPTTDSGTEIAGAMNYDHTSKEYSAAFLGIRASNGELYNMNDGSSVSNGTEWKDSGDILSVKLNMDDNEISFSTNGATYTSAVSIGGNAIYSGTLHPVVFLADDEITTVNFGNPNWALSSGNADANGYGNFEYAVPSGYYAICTKNLAKYGG